MLELLDLDICMLWPPPIWPVRSCLLFLLGRLGYEAWCFIIMVLPCGMLLSTESVSPICSVLYLLCFIFPEKLWTGI